MIPDDKLGARVRVLELALALTPKYPGRALADIADELWQWAEHDATAKKLAVIGTRKPKPVD